MFKIPKWEDDVPKSKVDFGKKSPNKKKLASEPPQKKSKQQKGNKIQKEKSNLNKQNKNKKPNINVSLQKTNALNKGTLSKPFNLSKKGENKKQKSPITIHNENLKDGKKAISDGTETNKKKKSKKRKFNESLSNDSNNKAEVKSTKTNSDSNPSKAKRRKLNNNEELPQEGSILLQIKKKKKKGIKKSEMSTLHESKVDQKKEKIRQLLQLGSNIKKSDSNGSNLRQRMLERLKSAQFRFLNEKLYTTSGSEAQQLFQSDPAAFHTYHQGYQQQLKKWPVNPLDLIIKRVSKMPKSHLIADMGCGSSELSRRVSQNVRAFDLVAAAPGVEACDMAHTPLLAAALDAVVYCLALMGTDLTQYLVEANRVLKNGGHLLIAEVESRFDNVEQFTTDVERLGFKLKNLDKTHKVFFFMEFVKIRDPPAKKSKLPAISLKPCLYKKR